MNKPQLPEFLNNISVVLARPSHPSNIGAAARAMKTMGLTHLVLVAPQLIKTPMTAEPPIFDPNNIKEFSLPEESFILASGAADVLENARVVATLGEAIASSTLAYGLTSRRRELAATLKTPREAIPEVLAHAQNNEHISLVFGNETSGLSIDEVNLCNRLMTINGNPNYFSLNLSQAVQVVCYEVMSQIDFSLERLVTEQELATREQIAGMVGHMEKAMNTIGFFERRNSERLMRHMHALFGKTDITKEDIDILRGFFKTIENKVKSS